MTRETSSRARGLALGTTCRAPTRRRKRRGWRDELAATKAKKDGHGDARCEHPAKMGRSMLRPYKGQEEDGEMNSPPQRPRKTGTATPGVNTLPRWGAACCAPTKGRRKMAR